MWMPTRTLIKETQNFLRIGRQIYRKCDFKKVFSAVTAEIHVDKQRMETLEECYEVEGT